MKETFRRYIVVAEVTISEPAFQREMGLLINILIQDWNEAQRIKDIIGGHVNDAIQTVPFVQSAEVMMVREM